MPANNSVNFLGRISNDIKVTPVGSGQNAFNKANFSIAIDRRLSNKEKQDKAQGAQVKTAYFAPMEATGATADMIAKYFAKGKPISVSAYYDEYSYLDSQTQQKKYGHKFIIESVSFVPSDGTQNAGGGQQNTQQNTQQYQPVDTQYVVSQDDLPF